MRLPGKLRYRLLVLWLASVALTLLVVAASFQLLLTNLHERESRLKIGHAFGTMASWLSELEARLSGNAALLAARPDVTATLHLISDYQDPAQYQPYLFDLEKERLAKEMGQQASAARIHFFAAYDRSGELVAFYAEQDGNGVSGFQSFQGAHAVFLAPDSHKPVIPPRHLGTAPPPGNGIAYVAGDGALMLSRSLPVYRDGGHARREGSVVVGQVLDPALISEAIDEPDLRFALAASGAGQAGAFGVELSRMGAALPLLGQADLADDASWRLPHPDLPVGAMRLPLDGGHSAFLVLAADKSRLKVGLDLFQRAAFAGSGAIAVVLLPLGLIALRRTISAPVERLTRAVLAVRDGHFEKVEWRGGAGELAELAEAVDDMAGRIRERTRELEATVDEISRSNAELQQFAHVAAHDLKEPARLVVSYAQLLERRLGPRLDGEEREFLGYLIGGARRMHALVDDILAHSQVGLQELAFVPVDTGAVVAAVLDTLRQAIAAAGAEIHVGQLPQLTGNAIQLQQVFQNIVGNAVKFAAAERRPVVRIDAERRPGEWLFTVADNGIGMEPQYLERIFQVSQRLHTQDRYPGTGMGLPICRRIIGRHGGRIWAESSPGEGTRFRFTLPAEPAV